jgi:hypothetical protein
MGSHHKRFYMIRLEGGLWEPRIKYPALAKAMEVACLMSEHHGKPATVLQTFSRVQIVDGKPVWEEMAPTR